MAADNVLLLNTVWDNASEDYQSRIPQATRDNIKEVGNAIMSFQATQNEFVSAIVNRIGLVTVSSKMAKNRLAKFKKGMLEYGDSIEEIFTEMAQATPYDIVKAEDEVFKRVDPNVKAVFHKINREDKYKVTITEFQLKRAFLSNDGLGKLVASIINSMYSGDNHDEYILMKQLTAYYGGYDSEGTYHANQDRYKIVDTPKVNSKETAMEFAKAVRQVSTDMTFMNDDLNFQEVNQYSETGEQVLLIHKNVNTQLNMELLAWAFNKEEVDFKTQIVVVDDFGTMGDTQAVLVDKAWFMVYDTLFQTSSQYNGEGLYWNYWLHHHQLLSTSPFQQAVRFRISDPDVYVSPQNATADVEGTKQFSVEVTSLEDTSVTWSSSDDSIATIDANGLATVTATAESGNSVTITATASDGSTTGTATLTVN